MKNIFEEWKKRYEEQGDSRADMFADKAFEYGKKDALPEEKLQYLILKKRYENLGRFLENQKQYYKNLDIGELQNQLFFYNDLKEIHFIGTDLYANALFLKNDVPFLYRCVGNDNETCKNISESGPVKSIFEACVSQIEMGRKEPEKKQFSYSKCFGVALYQYANQMVFGSNNIVFEVRKNATVNAVLEGESVLSMQQYARRCVERKASEGEDRLPYFSVDMSDTRNAEVKNLETWITDDIKIREKTDWNWRRHIVDPIGDGEVVCNFTNEGNILCDKVDRITLHGKEELCRLLYSYFEMYADQYEKKYPRKKHTEEDGKNKSFRELVEKSVGTLKEYEDGKYFRFYKEKIMSAESCLKKSGQENISIAEISKKKIEIDWDVEMRYMSANNKEGETVKVVADRNVYKGKEQEPYSSMWKDILFFAVRGQAINYGYGGAENE